MQGRRKHDGQTDNRGLVSARQPVSFRRVNGDNGSNGSSSDWPLLSSLVLKSAAM
ncbi:MAG: hypothetical protein ACKVII_07380 [Planctomycetales bacterium]